MAGASGSPDAVDVDLLVLGALVVDDVSDVVDVDAAGRHIGGHEHIDFTVAEGPQRLFARALAEVPVQGGRGEAAGGQVVGDASAGAFGAREDDSPPAVGGLEDAGDDLDLVQGVGAVDDLLGRLDRHALVAGVLGADMRRLGHVPPGQGHDGAGHGGAEQHRLAVRARARQDLLHVW